MQNLLQDLQTERQGYGQRMTNDECVALLNAVAFRNPGFALAEKRGGNNGRRSDGALVSVDGLIWTADRTFIDVLRDAGAKSEPSWQVHALDKINPETGQLHKPFMGTLVMPIDPGTSVPTVVAPSPPPHPAGPTIHATELGAGLQALESRLATLEARLAGLEARPTVSLDDVLRRLEALEHAEYAVDVGTSRELGHAHQVQTTIVRVK
jgi:hypothetical protein